MNLFLLSRDPLTCAMQHCDKHVVKMIIEYAQLLSTAHRVLDGRKVEWRVTKPDGKIKKLSHYHMDYETSYPSADENGKPMVAVINERIYKASHVNHPAAIWCRASEKNYNYLYELFIHLCTEYTRSYGKVHKTQALAKWLDNYPKNIPKGIYTDPPLTMPDEYKVDDAVTSYQNLYVGSKARFAKWTNRRPPNWFIERTPNYDEAHFERTR